MDLVIGGSALALIYLYAAGILKIPFTLLFAAVGTLSAIGLGLPRVFPRSSRAPSRPVYFSVAAFILATVSFVYSFFNGEAWVPILVGGFFTFVGVAAMLVAVFRTPKASDSSGSSL